MCLRAGIFKKLTSEAGLRAIDRLSVVRRREGRAYCVAGELSWTCVSVVAAKQDISKVSVVGRERAD